MLADIIAVTLTWAKTFYQWRQSRSLNMEIPVSTLLLRDGEIAAQMRLQ
jgi:hypothetical protein